jgi:hypothetical protein
MQVSFQIVHPESYDTFVDTLNSNIDREAKNKRGLLPLYYYAYSAKDDEGRVISILVMLKSSNVPIITQVQSLPI